MNSYFPLKTEAAYQREIATLWQMEESLRKDNARLRAEVEALKNVLTEAGIEIERVRNGIIWKRATSGGGE